MIHKGWDEHFVVKAVATSGGSLNLAQNQMAVVNLTAQPTRQGTPIIGDFTELPLDTQVAIKVGSADIPVNRTQTNHTWQTRAFDLSEVVGLRVDAPSVDWDTDEMIIGYDGFNPDTALSFSAGDSEELSLELFGTAMGLLGYPNARTVRKIHFEAPATGEKGTDWTDQEIVENAVERLKRLELVGGQRFDFYYDVTPVNSENPATVDGVNKQFYELVVEDDGSYAALAAVQSQYLDYKVVRANYDGSTSTYNILGDTGLSLDDFVITPNSKLKGCATCPADYTALEQGYVYSISIEDLGEDVSSDITTALTNEVSNTVTRVGGSGTTGYYTIVLTAAIIADDQAALVTAQPTAIVTLVSDDVQDLCAPDNTTDISWTTGETCKAEQYTYTIVVKDDECGTNRLTELQAAYPDLSISVADLDGDNPSACSTQYETTVTSNIVCEECSPMFRDLFISEAPDDFEFTSWQKAPKEYSADALMGIRIKAKKNVLSPSEAAIDEVPFYATSARIKVAGGYPTTVSESFNAGRDGRFNVKVLSIGTEPENLGGNLRAYEDMARVRHTGKPRHKGNNYAKEILGEETQLEGLVNYVDYVLKVRTNKYAQSFSGEKNETYYYHFLVAPGKHTAVESILNKIAAKAGVKPVQAFSNEV